MDGRRNKVVWSRRESQWRDLDDEVMLSSRKRYYWSDLLDKVRPSDLLDKGGRTSSTMKRRRRYDGDNARQRAHHRPSVYNVCLQSAVGGKSTSNLSEASIRISLHRQLQSEPTIPEDLLFSKVLILLSPHKWFQFRCVCRSWNALLPGRLLGPKVLSADQQPWPVFIKFFGSDFKSIDDLRARTLLVYIPSSGRWLPFPLPFPICPQPSYPESAANSNISKTAKYNISSLLGPGLQNTHPLYLQHVYGHWHPLMASAGGLICTLVYNKQVVEADRLPIPRANFAVETYADRGCLRFNVSEFYNKLSDSNWASLLLFNPLTGKALLEPLPPDPIMVRIGLSLSVVQVYNCSSDATTDDRNCEYYVVLSAIPFGFVDSRAALWIYDVKSRSWKENIASAGIKTCKFGAGISFRNNYLFDISAIHTADGRVLDILRDADILTYQLSFSLIKCVMPEEKGMSWLFGYSIQKNVWMVTKLAEPRCCDLKWDEFVVWKDSASCRIYLAAGYGRYGTPSPCAGFNVWELKHIDSLNANVDPQISYYWHHLSTTPSEMWTHAPLMFITAGSTVCGTSQDYDFDFEPDSPPVRNSHPIMYDAVSNTWSKLPHTPQPSRHTEKYLGQVPLLALQPSLDDKML